MTCWAVILAGGVGSRFWPISTPERPKQLLPLAGDQTLLHDTLRRLQPLVPGDRTLVLTNEALVPAIAAASTPFGVPAANLLAEPVPAGTAAALAWAAVQIERRAGRDAVMLCVHADWAVAEEDKFRAALSRAADVAHERHSLVTIGVVPTRPDPGYGYIHRGAAVTAGVYTADRFVEKPNRTRAAEMVAEGCLWNSGIFVWRAGDFLDELERHTPEVAPALRAARQGRAAHGGDRASGHAPGQAPDARAFFAAVQPVSIDVGLLERSARVLVLPGDFGWDDVGTWAALARTRELDAAGNAVYGPVYAKDAAGNVVHAEGGAVVLYGVSDLVVVTREGLTVVTTIERSADLKSLVESLPGWLTGRPIAPRLSASPMSLYLYDDARARSFEPFALTRPASELCAGALITRQRWGLLYGEAVAGAIVADHLRDFTEFDAPPAATDLIPAGSFIANSRCIPAIGPAPAGDIWVCDGRVAAVRLATALDPASCAGGHTALDALAPSGGIRANLPGRWADDIWSYIRDLSAQLTADVPALAAAAGIGRDGLGTATVIGPRDRLYIERDAIIEPYTVFDVTGGPILVRRAATVLAFTRVIGPCAIGEGSVVVGDRIAASSIGERCKVHGELSSSIVMGCTNKSHDGFVGHSYLGRWVNLGAGTITSNLKNTYGPVQLWTPEGTRNTGETFLGSFLGDYARTGIGTRLTTGTVMGAGANVFPPGVAPKVIPAFAWGSDEPFATFALPKFLEVAERQMARRTVALTDAGRRYLTAAHHRATNSAASQTKKPAR